MADPNVQFCPDCGTVLPDHVPRSDLELAQTEHTEDLRAIATMKRRLADEGANRTKQDEAVFVAWCEATIRDPHTTTFGKARQAVIKRARRDGYTQDQLLLAVQLAGTYRYLVFGAWRETGSPSDLKNDLTDILKDESRIDSLLAKAGGEGG